MKLQIGTWFSFIKKYKIIILLPAFISILMVCEIIRMGIHPNLDKTNFLSSFQTTPWASIGGCGAGGSGGGSASVKWVGQGVTGGLIDVQIMTNYLSGRDYWNRSFSSRLSFKSTRTTQLGLTIPVGIKFGPVQPTTALPRSYEQTGGLGDISIDGSVNLGTEGQYCFSLSAALPTGQYNIIRGYDQKSNILPLGLQSGIGLIIPTVGLSYSKDVTDGIWIADISYTHPVAASISGKNEFLDTYYSAFKDSTNNKRFYYHFKSYGENDLGDYIPPSISATLYYGHRANKYTHSFGASFSSPLGVGWIHEESIIGNSSLYNPRPDADNKAWSGQVSYGIEHGSDKFPFFLAIAKPIHDKTSSTDFGKWDGPDWKAFLNEWCFTLGIKSTLF